MKDVKKQRAEEYRTFQSETVVFDNEGNRMVSCPTEEEAIEYIREHQKEEEA